MNSFPVFRLLRRAALGAGLGVCFSCTPGGRPAADPTPPIPYEDAGACPFEGCVYREWTANRATDLYRERGTSSPVVSRVAAGDRVAALTGVVVTVAPGQFRARDAYSMSTQSGAIQMNPGDTAYLLTYEGEGTYTVWFDDVIHRGADVSGMLSGACRPPDGCPGEIVAQPETVWWVRIRTAEGLEGWTNQPERFDGKDRLQ
jgi:hypothetical protein